MNIYALKANALRILELCNQVQALTATGRSAHPLSDYVAMAYARILAVEHGENAPFAEACATATTGLQALLALPTATLNAQFVAHHPALLALLNQYVHCLQLGFQHLDAEAGITPPV